MLKTKCGKTITVGLIKSGALAGGLADIIAANILRRGFTILKSIPVTFSEEQVREFYKDHVGKPYWDNLRNSVMGPDGVVALLLTTNTTDVVAFQEFRRVIGESSDPIKCSPTSLRGIFSDCFYKEEPGPMANNAIHGSDSLESADREARIVFSTEDLYSVVVDS